MANATWTFDDQPTLPTHTCLRVRPHGSSEDFAEVEWPYGEPCPFDFTPGVTYDVQTSFIWRQES